MMSSFSGSFFAGNRPNGNSLGRGSFSFLPVNNTYLNYPPSSDWNISGDLSLSWWQFQTNNGNENFISSLGIGNAFAVSIASGGGKINLYFGGSKIASPTLPISIQNVWVHFAVSRISSTIYIFMNGSLLSSFSNSSSIAGSSLSWYIGLQDPSGNTNDNWPGYISDYHFVNGSSIFGPSNFPVPTSRPLPVSNSKLLLYPKNPGLMNNDYSGTNKSVSNNLVSYISNSPL